MLRRLSVLVVLLVLCWSGVAAGQGGSAREQLRGDALLADVCHVGERLAWAVGDRGAIWHTSDGGRSWRRQESAVDCRLNSVMFVDKNNGWAAGGWTQPYTHTTRGVVLRTTDGGRHWTPVERLLLPTLVKIKFFNPRQGVAIGRASELFPSGVFTTDDGGRSWTTLSAQMSESWRTGDFVSRNIGALAGNLGSLATVRRRTIESAKGGGGLLRLPAAMRLVPPSSGWLVGDGGLILATGDLGGHWQSPPSGLSAVMAENFDLRAVDARGSHVWVAGSPGTRVFHTSDAGRTWEATATLSNVPLSALTFVDERRGYAVGALGTILTTDDGGRSWRVARRGGSRAALLGVFSQAEDIPLELFAKLSVGDGYLSAVDVLCRRAPSEMSTELADLAERTHEALVAVGGSSAEAAWSFPIRQPGLRLSIDQLVGGLDRANDGRAIERLEERVVRKIRMWRPEVIVTHDAAPQGDRPLAHLINQVVLRAVEAAADPTQHVVLAREVGLAPWRVKKVYGTLPPGERGSTNLNTTALVPQLGRSPADVASSPRGLVATAYDQSPSEIGFHLLVDDVPQDRGRRDFFSGVTLAIRIPDRNCWPPEIAKMLKCTIMG
ncbi:MAG: YCF48-related protein, partial [Thermoguttaceae bacterium]